MSGAVPGCLEWYLDVWCGTWMSGVVAEGLTVVHLHTDGASEVPAPGLQFGSQRSWFS